MSDSNTWERLRSFTGARIALGRTGGSLPTSEMLKFRGDHALARDSVWADLDSHELASRIEETINSKTTLLHSQVDDRQEYIKRPDLGRKLDQPSVEILETLSNSNDHYDIDITIADGLSALAVERHAVPFLQTFLPLMSNFSLAPITIVSQGRVAISDEIGQLLKSKLSIILIGERPGLSSPDSLGVYMTYNPKSGNTDESRNCISNIRSEGLSYEFAANKLSFLVNESIRRKLSGVDLKDTFDRGVLDE